MPSFVPDKREWEAMLNTVDLNKEVRFVRLEHLDGAKIVCRGHCRGPQRCLRLLPLTRAVLVIKKISEVKRFHYIFMNPILFTKIRETQWCLSLTPTTSRRATVSAVRRRRRPRLTLPCPPSFLPPCAGVCVCVRCRISIVP